MGVPPFQAARGLLTPAGTSKTLPGPLDPLFPPLYLSSEETTRRYVRKCRTSKTASYELFAGIAAKPYLRLPKSSLHPMLFTNPILLKHQQYVVSPLFIHIILFLRWAFFFPHSFPHMTGLCCRHNCAKTQNSSVNRVMIKSRMVHTVASLKTP